MLYDDTFRAYRPSRYLNCLLIDKRPLWLWMLLFDSSSLVSIIMQSSPLIASAVQRLRAFPSTGNMNRCWPTQQNVFYPMSVLWPSYRFPRWRFIPHVSWTPFIYFFMFHFPRFPTRLISLSIFGCFIDDRAGRFVFVKLSLNDPKRIRPGKTGLSYIVQLGRTVSVRARVGTSVPVELFRCNVSHLRATDRWLCYWKDLDLLLHSWVQRNT